MGHQPPDAEWFEKGIVALDQGEQAIAGAGVGKEPEAAEKPAEKAAVKAQAKPASVAKAAASSRPDVPDAALTPSQEADKLLKLARLYVDNRLYNKAREKLKQLVKDHPNTPQATEAEKLLKEIGKG
jgi:hypothetical protein